VVFHNCDTFNCLPPPLTGIRVIDLSTVVAGPTASMILADLGADVIKVERIDGGDDARHMGPHLGDWGAFFIAVNRGKRSIAADITKPAGRELVLRLARSADVFLENFRGGKIAALGLDEPAVRAQNPRVIYASLSAYGARGPDALKPGYDALIQGRTGIVSVTGSGPDSPTRAGVSVIDAGAGMWMATGILAALIERGKSGVGQRVDASLFQTGIMAMAYYLVYRQFLGRDPLPQGSTHAAFAPYCAFETADGRMMIGCSNDRLFRRLCTALNREDWFSDARFASNILRVHNRAELEGGLQTLFKEKSTAHWTALLDAHDVPVSPIQNTGQVLDDPQLAALGQLQAMHLPGNAATPVVIPRLPFELSETPSAIGGPPPMHGEHARSILTEAGYSESEIEQLVNAGVCKLP
jgi:crotonobetainyl-CoA:carnitine CoA-transferase CaiB-like acyl-CoA transferase